jgi:hypothetical protein
LICFIHFIFIFMFIFLIILEKIAFPRSEEACF